MTPGEIDINKFANKAYNHKMIIAVTETKKLIWSLPFYLKFLFSVEHTIIWTVTSLGLI